MNLACFEPARGWACVLLMVICFGGWGCHSPKDASRSAFAAVTIKDRSILDIRRVTKRFFRSMVMPNGRNREPGLHV